MAQTVNYLTEHNLLEYDVLVEKTSETVARYNELSVQIKAAEKRLAEIAVLKTQIINYAKTRDTYVAYRKAGYSKKFLAEHESDILLHKAAKKSFDELGVKKLPAVKSLQAEYAALLAEKKAAYTDYRNARNKMKELLTVKANVDHLLGTDRREAEREKDHGQR
jgi:transcriptional regulator